MSGVSVFKNGVVRLDNPEENHVQKVLVHKPTDEVITSYEQLERKLVELEWERLNDDPELLKFHKRSSVNLISLPRDFSHLKSVHTYDIVVKNRETFTVRDI